VHSRDWAQERYVEEMLMHSQRGQSEPAGAMPRWLADLMLTAEQATRRQLEKQRAPD